MGNFFSKLMGDENESDLENQQLIQKEVKRQLAEIELEEQRQTLQEQQLSGGTYLGTPTMQYSTPGLYSGIDTRGPPSPWISVGLIYTKNRNNNRMMKVQGQMVDPRRRRFSYRFLNSRNGIMIPYKGGKEIYELIDGDTLRPIPGLESLGPWVYQKNNDIIF